MQKVGNCVAKQILFDNNRASWPNVGQGMIPSLDGIRAVSIMLVFFSHAGASELIPGGFGVTIFFFLSGFLITTLLCREYVRTNKIDLLLFYLRRLVRLGPPLLLTISLAFGIAYLGLASGDFSFEATAAQVFFFYNYYTLLPASENSIDGLGILWSLAVEEHFYLIWPAIFIFISRGVIMVRHIIMILTVIIIWRSVRLFIYDASEWTIYISTDTRFDSLLYGCLLALLMAQNRLPDWLQRRQSYYLLIFAGLGCLILSFVWRDPIFRSTVRYTLQGVALMPIFFYAVTKSDNILFRPLNHWIFRCIGIYSYTLYLAHFVILHTLWNVGFVKGELLTTVFAMVLSLIWAALVYRFAEQPLHSLRARLNAPQGAGA